MAAIHGDAEFDPVKAFEDRWAKDAPAPSDDTADEDDNEETDYEDGEAGEDAESDRAPDDDADEDEESDGGSDEADDDSEHEDDETDDGAEEEEGSRSKKVYVDAEDAFVKIKVDGKEVEAPLKDLKRLYGQEAALTRKSQEVAELRKKSEETGAMHVAGLEGLLERARVELEPYSKLNFLALAKDPNISPEELQALTDAANKAYGQVQFLEQELGGVIQYHNQKRHESLVTQARETHKLLSDPNNGIEGWSEPLYNEIRDFAAKQGLPQDVVDTIVDPVGIKILHMAMQYHKGKSSVTQVQSKSSKKKSPKRIVKGQSAEVVSKSKGRTRDDAMRRLQHSGSTDDAVDAFMARWSRN